jgi:hypothetical protein
MIFNGSRPIVLSRFFGTVTFHGINMVLQAGYAVRPTRLLFLAITPDLGYNHINEARS